MNNQDDKIVSKNEEVVQETKKPVCKKAMYAFYGSFVYLVMLVLNNFIFVESSEVFSTILGIIAFTCFFGSIILGIVSLNEIKKKVLSGKKFAIMGIVLPIVFFVLTFIILILLNPDEFIEGFKEGYNCGMATKCVDNGDGTSTCLNDGKEVKCQNEFLGSSQFE